MPGEVIELEGDARALVAAVIHLDGYDFALIGGLAVMVRLQEAHRVTSDLDGVFDNPTASRPLAGTYEAKLRTRWPMTWPMSNKRSPPSGPRRRSPRSTATTSSTSLPSCSTN